MKKSALVLFAASAFSAASGTITFDFESGDLQGWQVTEGRFEREIMSIADFRAFIRTCGVPVTLGEKGVTAADIPAIVEGVKTVSFNADGVLASNPPVTAEMLTEILTCAL